VPLTMGELIALIDSADNGNVGSGLTNSSRNYNKEALLDPLFGRGLGARDSVETLVDFVTVTSAFYPQLQAYYEDEAREWLKAVVEEMDELADEGSL
jgi:hypothetical protein